MRLEWRKVSLLLGDYRNATDEERAARKELFLADLAARGEAEANPVYQRLRAKSTALIVVLTIALVVLGYAYYAERQQLQCYETSNNMHQVQQCLQNP